MQTMGSRFMACLPVILESEGGFVNDPHDPGGPTNLGITQKTLSAWQKRPAGVLEVQNLTPAQVAPIYFVSFWCAAHCGDCPPGVDLMAFDEAVNQGPGRALRTLQEAVGAVPDGVCGPATQAALAASLPAQTVERIADLREVQYRALPTFGRFGKGWLARLARTKALALEAAQ